MNSMKPASCSVRGCDGLVIEDGRCFVCDKLVQPLACAPQVRSYCGDAGRNIDYEGPEEDTWLDKRQRSPLRQRPKR
jgi:hypothetical protein